MQVDPLKPTLKAPETNRLKLEYQKMLSSFAFKFNLRRYNVVAAMMTVLVITLAIMVRWCRMTLSIRS